MVRLLRREEALADELLDGVRRIRHQERQRLAVGRPERIQDPVRGQGFRLVSRELMLYLDPVTGQRIDTWKNPWTGAEVSVAHVANDPVNQRPMFERDAQGRPFVAPFRIQGDRVFMPAEIPLFYPNPMAGDYQDYVGNQYHAMEIFDFAADR
ncbi:MAG: DUF1838 family protein, partial [Microbacterium sp.]|nr:DUF1838 family protein [Microbacterium sp.]